MHIALALGQRTVVLFGPTSAPEIELYGLGEKVYQEMGCLGCYKQRCDFNPNCMDLISVDMVADAVRRQLQRRRRALEHRSLGKCNTCRWCAPKGPTDVPMLQQ